MYIIDDYYFLRFSGGVACVVVGYINEYYWYGFPIEWFVLLSLVVLTMIIVCFSGGMARVVVVGCIDDDYCLFFQGNGSCSCSWLY